MTKAMNRKNAFILTCIWYNLFQVFSGYDDSGQSYGRFCGNSIPPEIVSVDEALLLRFKSDDTINSKGFSAAFVIIDEADNQDYEYSAAAGGKKEPVYYDDM